MTQSHGRIRAHWKPCKTWPELDLSDGPDCEGAQPGLGRKNDHRDLEERLSLRSSAGPCLRAGSIKRTGKSISKILLHMSAPMQTCLRYSVMSAVA